MMKVAISTFPMLDTQPFRVVRIYFRLPPEHGGMEAHIARLSDAQRELGIEVLNVFNVGESAAPGVQLFKGFDLLRVRPAILRNLIFYMGALKARRHLLGTFPTVLHVHGDWSDFLFSRILAKTIGAEIIVASLHDVVDRRKSFLYRYALRPFDLIFSTGKDDQRWLENILHRQVYHLPSAPLDVFFQPLFSDISESCDVVTVVNFYSKKRVDLVIECAKRRPSLRFLVYGDGPQREMMIEKADSLGLINIEFPGRKSPRELVGLLQLAKVFLLTSETEGTPTAVLEAMAVGLPVVVTPSNDYEWLIEKGVNGYVTESWSIEEIVTALDLTLSDEAARVSMGLRNKQRAEKFSWRANAQVMNTLMAERINLVERE